MTRKCHFLSGLFDVEIITVKKDCCGEVNYGVSIMCVKKDFNIEAVFSSISDVKEFFRVMHIDNVEEAKYYVDDKEVICHEEMPLILLVE